jgi:hypothetical protein
LSVSLLIFSQISSAKNGVKGAKILANSLKTNSIVATADFLSSTSSVLNLSLDLLIYQAENSSTKSTKPLAALSNS